MQARERIIVAMSGGVDSSVAAALLVQQGYDVVGLMLRLWSEPDQEQHNRCCTPDSMSQARRVAAILGIPFYTLDAKEVFRSTVVQGFIDGYASGITPNPCLVCNKNIRWGFLLDHALELGARWFATGHYARLRRDTNNQVCILRAIDTAKDQSYVLHSLNQDQLAYTVFPLGEHTKTDVRELARKFNLPVAKRPDSQDLCFLGDSDYRAFIRRNAPDLSQNGPIYNSAGLKIGIHQGLAYYTIGQRKGLGLASQIPLYVINKDTNQNALIVGSIDELGQSDFFVDKVNWINQKPGNQKSIHAQVKIRYKAAEVSCLITPRSSERVYVELSTPVRDITPGQAAVFYDGDLLLGGGIIT